ncbi:putative endolysin [Pseudomonas phage Ep4]|uniref:Lysozyme n=1 Tax=Pseudomonas phage Ep4 TaxID=3057492 RepID=A0AAU9EEF5_9CAUD|nr:putative endolysin [Pseudomonas phage Ep4]
MPKMDAKSVSKLTGILFAAIASVVVYNEGYKEVAYQDSANVWTICYGETNGVRPGQVSTRAACDKQLQASVNEHSKALVGLPEGMPHVVTIGAIDAAYNLGVDQFRNSQVYSQLLLRNYTDAGKAVLAFRYITVDPKKYPDAVLAGPKGNKYDCSQFVQGKPNTVCYGLWKRRQWQSQAISNKYETPEVAIRMLPR